MKMKTGIAALLAFLLASPCKAAESAPWWIIGIGAAAGALYLGAHANNDRNDSKTAHNEAARLRLYQTDPNWQADAAALDHLGDRERKSAKQFGGLALVAATVAAVGIGAGLVLTVRSNYVGLRKEVRF